MMNEKYRHTDTQTHRHTDIQTQTHRHTDIQTYRMKSKILVFILSFTLVRRPQNILLLKTVCLILTEISRLR